MSTSEGLNFQKENQKYWLNFYPILQKSLDSQFFQTLSEEELKTFVQDRFQFFFSNKENAFAIQTFSFVMGGRNFSAIEVFTLT